MGSQFPVDVGSIGDLAYMAAGYLTWMMTHLKWEWTSG